MKIGLIQEKQNRLYHFLNPKERYTLSEASELQKEMIEQNLLLIKQAGEAGCNLILTSEAINYPGQPKKMIGDYRSLIPKQKDCFFEKLSFAAREAKAYLAAGVFYEDNAGKYRNGIFFYNPAGELMEIYHKIHLAGEENEYLTPGTEYKIVETEYGRIGFLICYDMQFPDTVKALSLRKPDLILCPTWGWESGYGHSEACENKVYVAAAMAVPVWGPIEGVRTPSQIVSPRGEVLAQGSYTEQGVVICEFQPTVGNAERK